MAASNAVAFGSDVAFVDSDAEDLGPVRHEDTRPGLLHHIPTWEESPEAETMNVNAEISYLALPPPAVLDPAQNDNDILSPQSGIILDQTFNMVKVASPCRQETRMRRKFYLWNLMIRSLMTEYWTRLPNPISRGLVEWPSHH